MEDDFGLFEQLMFSFFPVHMFASGLFKMLFPKERFSKIRMLMMRIITVPLS